VTIRLRISLALGLAGVVAFAFRDSPLAVLATVTALNLMLREEFPFSHFPMYADFSPRALYVRVTDGDGQPVALRGMGAAAPLLTKVYWHERRQAAARLGLAPSRLSEAQLREPGTRTLAFVVGQAALTGALLPSRLHLYEVDLTLRAGRIERREQLVAARGPC
jgi:hypothetical protein